MTSGAGKTFAKNCADIDRLLEIHQTEGGTGPGRRTRLEVLNKSAIVLVTVFWEAYCEDVAAEALDYIVRHTNDGASLPKELRKIVAKELKTDLDELAVWRLADKGWRRVLSSRLDALKEERDRQLNTPKTKQIDDLFERALGLPGISKSWHWGRMSARRAGDKLDEFVSLRGSIAHRGSGAAAVRKHQVDDYYDHVKYLVDRTDARISEVVKAATRRAPW
jgi:RiboL-PSP-HEPN